LLVHDLLLSKKGIAAPQSHPLNLAVSRHKARLQAEFTKFRIRKGFASVGAFRESIEAPQDQSNDDAAVVQHLHPRWIRINTLLTTFDAQVASTFSDYERVDSLESVMTSSRDRKIYHVDKHIENLIAVPPHHDLSKSSAYRSGQLIFQDKASCIPAVLLDPMGVEMGDTIDACAAPGNKTTHLAALVETQSTNSQNRMIFAVERDALRSQTMHKMVAQAGASKVVTILGSTDFLQVRPNDEKYQNVSSILLDPSCSGSGIVGRDDQPSLELPASPATPAQSQRHHNPRKRNHQGSQISANLPPLDHRPAEIAHAPDISQASEKRLEALSNFQLKILQHAMLFPAARRIVYSTCSVHAEENEGVVVRALCSQAAIRNGWDILPRDRQVPGLRAWSVRGDQLACQQLFASELSVVPVDKPKIVANACIRCEKGTVQGTMGFFATGFTRGEQPEAVAGVDINNEQEWEGFSDSD
jgi:putative methyltransferase